MEDIKKNRFCGKNPCLVCEQCNEAFTDQRKLGKHTFKIYIQNPEYVDLYMKNWVKRNDCIQVFQII